MATYDPQKGHARPKPASDEPAPVDELLDAADEGPAPVEPAAPPMTVPAPETPPVGGAPKAGPAKKVGLGVALTAVVFALSWAFRRKRRNRAS